MNQKTKTLLIRTATGAVYVALMVAGTFCFPLMVLLMCLTACVGLYEFSKLTSGPTDTCSCNITTVFSIVLFALLGYWGLFLKGSIFVNSAFLNLWFFYLSIPIWLFSLVIILSILELFRHRAIPIEQIAKNIFGVMWITIPLAALTVFSHLNARVVLAFLILIWMSDTFAYLGGSLYGRNKMCPHISPGKTWEGTATGFILTILLSIILSQIPYFGIVCPEMWKWALLAVIVTLFGTLGDLIESLFKRNAGIKDSGNILPGHGGILDRFDSILFTTIPTLAFYMLVMK